MARKSLDKALGGARAFDEAHGVGVARIVEDQPPSEAAFVFQAQTKAARVVNLDTGVMVAELPLVALAALPFDMLDMPESEMGGLDVLGMRLGMSFADADALIRRHMPVGKVLMADRTKQFGLVSGELMPYTSGRIYASAENNELIAIFDEPPASSDTVLGIWRILRLPRGDADPAALKDTLSQRYGTPSSVQEVSLPFMNKGIAFLWSDLAHDQCRPIDFDFQTGLWQDDNGDATWLPPFMTQPRYPILGYPLTFGVVNQNFSQLPLAGLCPLLLGVRYATYGGSDHGAPVGDEIVTWLSDNRAYAKLFYESRNAPVGSKTPADSIPADRAAPRIKF